MTQNEKPGLRRCVACGYDLFGLGDEPRCPECGLVNIPEGFRREVWELVDSGKWFFSGFFSPFRKRPPGWWWALDRENDLRRSVRAAARNVLLASTIIAAAILVGDSARIEVTHTWYSFLEPELESAKFRLAYGWGGLIHRVTDFAVADAGTQPRVSIPRYSVTAVMKWAWPNLKSAVAVASVACWVILTWALPASVGLWTQIRKGLPEFARPPRTIFSASMYESHRLIYLAILISFASVIDVATRIKFLNVSWSGRPNPIIATAPSPIPAIIVLVSGLALVAFAAVGWAGPLRSDFTRQLIRSRLHAARVVLMYAVVLPLALAAALSSLQVFL